MTVELPTLDEFRERVCSAGMDDTEVHTVMNHYHERIADIALAELNEFNADKYRQKIVDIFEKLAE